MNQLNLITQNGKPFADSREVALMVGKEHKNLLRDIKGYVEILDGSNLSSHEFFIPSTYINSQNKEQPNYLLSRKGCDMVANKMTGEKGILFTAVYVSKFEEMEKTIAVHIPSSPLEVLQLAVNQMIEQEKEIKEIKLENQLIKQENSTLKHRIDNLDAIDTIGDLQQRLNRMVKRYAWSSGIDIGTAWKHFDQSFNTAYRTNITSKRNNYAEKHGLKTLTRPQYLSLVNQLEDAIRVADKMLSQTKQTG